MVKFRGFKIHIERRRPLLTLLTVLLLGVASGLAFYSINLLSQPNILGNNIPPRSDIFTKVFVLQGT